MCTSKRCVGAVLRGLPGRMQRKAEEREPAHAGERRHGLRLRGHPPAERFAAGEKRQVRQCARGRGHRGAHRRLRHLRRVGPFAPCLHIGKLIAQRRDAAFGESVRDRRHERVRSCRLRRRAPVRSRLAPAAALAAGRKHEFRRRRQRRRIEHQRMTPGASACAAAGRQLTAAILVSQAAPSRASGAGKAKASGRRHCVSPAPNPR